MKRAGQTEFSSSTYKKQPSIQWECSVVFFHKILDITSWALRPVSPVLVPPVLPELPCPPELPELPEPGPELVPEPLRAPRASWAPQASCMRLSRRTPLPEISHKLMPKPSSLRFHLLYKMCPEIVGKAKVNLCTCQENFFNFHYGIGPEIVVKAREPAAPKCLFSLDMMEAFQIDFRN
jgi:hypothetical protein